MYVKKDSAFEPAQLDQGDIIRGVLLPQIPGEKAVHHRPANTNKAMGATELQLKTSPTTELRSLVPLEAATVMVVSNSCDNVRGGSLMVVPVTPLTLVNDPATQAHDAFQEVRRRATGGNWPSSFYLPSSIEHGIAQRSEALFDQIETLAPGYLLSNAKRDGIARLCGLNTDGVAHLRWALSYFFGRNSRDDFMWQTDEDLRLRLRHLFHQRANPKLRRAGFDEDLRVVVEEAKRRNIDVDALEKEFNEASERAHSTSARPA